MADYRVHIDRNSAAWQSLVYIKRDGSNGQSSVCTGIENGRLVYENFELGQMVEPVFTLHEEEYGILQALALELTRLKVKPEETQPIERELGATKKHLDDMRKITFHQLNIQE